MNPILFLAAIIACVSALYALYLGSRSVRPMLNAFMALGHNSDTLQARVFPMLAFLGLLAILLKLTIF